MKYFLFVAMLLSIGVLFIFWNRYQQKETALIQVKPSYWFILHRKANREYLYKGIPGNKEQSQLIKTFVVKTGIPGERPTPLPQLVGKKYWLITKKEASKENPETAPYFLTLDVPAPSVEPYGPTPYNECDGQQCNWVLPGAFGLHGINGDSSRLSKENPGSSGCIRHSDRDIAYLYNLLDPKKEQIRYYIENT
ncbi:MAG: L,D-transpeptidase [Candidatus Levybacteria bacterium]|nr:L,D-transpeptidase [Candidatus Levybacteria bacterium]